jgi:hypothetical protein
MLEGLKCIICFVSQNRNKDQACPICKKIQKGGQVKRHLRGVHKIKDPSGWRNLYPSMEELDASVRRTSDAADPRKIRMCPVCGEVTTNPTQHLYSHKDLCDDERELYRKAFTLPDFSDSVKGKMCLSFHCIKLNCKKYSQFPNNSTVFFLASRLEFQHGRAHF